jgi:hypothetical protein
MKIQVQRNIFNRLVFLAVHISYTFRARNYSKLPDNLQYLPGIAAAEQVDMH